MPSLEGRLGWKKDASPRCSSSANRFLYPVSCLWLLFTFLLVKISSKPDMWACSAILKYRGNIVQKPRNALLIFSRKESLNNSWTNFRDVHLFTVCTHVYIKMTTTSERRVFFNWRPKNSWLETCKLLYTKWINNKVLCITQKAIFNILW